MLRIVRNSSKRFQPIRFISNDSSSSVDKYNNGDVMHDPASLPNDPSFNGISDPSFNGISDPSLNGFSNAVKESSGAGLDVWNHVSTVEAPLEPLGHGFVDSSIRFFDYIHVMTGLPWWSSIVVGTIGMRLVFLPATIMGGRSSSRMQMAKPEMEVAQEKMKETGNLAAYQKSIKAIKDRHNVQLWQSLLPMAQFPVYISFFFGLQKIDSIFPSIESGGTLWFSNLSAADPTMILPIASSATMLGSILLGARDMPPSENRDMILKVMVGATFVFIPVTMNFPAALFMYWITTNLFSMSQSILLGIPGVKPALGYASKATTKTTTSTVPKVLLSTRPPKIRKKSPKRK